MLGDDQLFLRVDRPSLGGSKDLLIRLRSAPRSQGCPERAPDSLIRPLFEQQRKDLCTLTDLRNGRELSDEQFATARSGSSFKWA
jgi:hypothetical protein